MRTKREREIPLFNSHKKREVLRNLHQLAEDRHSCAESVLGRFFECQELQMASALLAKAVDQCSRWHGGKRLTPPGGSVPPTV
jgi:hypothetical protein